MYKTLPILLLVVLFSNEQLEDERILNYKVDIEVLDDGRLYVIEEITILAQGEKFKRGISRNVPTHYPNGSGGFNEVEMMIDEILRNGKPEFHQLVKEPKGKVMYIGQASVFLSPGEHTYTIKFWLSDQISFFQDYDELYYNVIGYGWEFPIDKVKIYITLPEGAKILQNAAYTGKSGEKGDNYSIKMKDNKIRYDNIHPFSHNTGITIAVAWPKGFIIGSENYNEEKQQISINRNDIYDDSWAVIIGIDKYQYSDPLNYAVKDAEAVKNMLIDKFDYPEENIRYLTDEEATLSNIKLNLGEVATSAGENDRILVFYSGHGQTLIGTDNSEKGYIIPYEGKQDNPYATGIAMDEILTTSQISKSKHMLFLMDACYSGLMTEHVKGLQPQEEGYLTKVANEQARQIITAGGNEPAIEGGRWNHSVFTKNLLSGLDDWDADTDNDGFITADELGTYLRKQVTEDSNNQQTPQKGRFMNSGTGEFVFFSDATITYPSTDVDEKDEDEIIYGCMDIEANNYNPNATNSDRSCQYGKVLTSLSFGYYDSVTGEIPIFIDTNENLSGFMFDISGAIILKAWGGIAESTGYGRIIINDGQDGLYFFSYLPDGSKIELDSLMPKGNNQILINLIIETTSDENVCIEDIYLFDGSSEFYDDGNIISNPIKSASFCFQT